MSILRFTIFAGWAHTLLFYGTDIYSGMIEYSARLSIWYFFTETSLEHPVVNKDLGEPNIVRLGFGIIMPIEDFLLIW